MQYPEMDISNVTDYIVHSFNQSISQLTDHSISPETKPSVLHFSDKQYLINHILKNKLLLLTNRLNKILNSIEKKCFVCMTSLKETMSKQRKVLHRQRERQPDIQTDKQKKQ